MWSKAEQRKNHFLQTQLINLKPQQINEMVTKGKPNWKERNGESFKTKRLELFETRNRRSICNKLNLSKSECKSAFYFEDRAVVPYGLLDLPKLMKELNSDDVLTQWRAINSLSEYIINPLFAQRALQQKTIAIVRRCQNLFLRIRYLFPKVKYRETARLLAIFYYLAMHRNGSQQILEHNHLLDQFYNIIYNREVHLETTSKIVSLISGNNANCLKLIDEYKVFDKLFDIWNRDVCVSYYPPDLWLHLTHMLELAPQEGIQKGFFEILHKRICGRLLQFHVWDIKCFGLLLRCKEGQLRFVQVDGIQLLHTILNEEVLDNYENVIFALMQGLFAKKSLWRCREFTNFPLILTKLAKDSTKREQQLFCLQTLREMGVMPVIKRFIKENCLDDIRNLKCEIESNERERKEILYWLERDIYNTTGLRKEPLS